MQCMIPIKFPQSTVNLGPCEAHLYIILDGNVKMIEDMLCREEAGIEWLYFIFLVGGMICFLDTV